MTTYKLRWLVRPPRPSKDLLLPTISLLRVFSLKHSTDLLVPAVVALFLLTMPTSLQSQGLPGDETRSLTIMVGGDIVLGRVAEGGLRPIGGPDPLGEIGHLLQGADLALVNLESPLCDVEGFTVHAPPGTLLSTPVFSAEPGGAALLAAAGVDAVALANNHINDCGREGLGTTLRALDQAGVVGVGASLPGPGERYAPPGMDPFAPVVVERSGVRIGILAATVWRNRGQPPPGSTNPVALADLERLQVELPTRVRALRTENRADVVLVSLHWGRENQDMPQEAQVALARCLVESGAQVVWGHHAHVLQPVEAYGRGIILYNTGNLVSPMSQPRSRISALFELELEQGEDGAWYACRVTLHPLASGDSDSGPTPEPGESGAVLLDRVTTLSCGEFATCFDSLDGNLFWERPPS